MNKMKKFALIAVCAMLLVCVTIGATVAWLTAQDQVTNTFTVGNVAITLDEAKVDDTGMKITGEGAQRVKANAYHLLPGNFYDKDPMVHVAANSDDCIVFVKVDNGLAGIEDDPIIAAQIVANGWTALPGETGVYYKSTLDSAGNPTPQRVTKGTELPVFESFKIRGNVDSTKLNSYAGKTITVTAYAIQFLDYNIEEVWNQSGFGA